MKKLSVDKRAIAANMALNCGRVWQLRVSAIGNLYRIRKHGSQGGLRTMYKTGTQQGRLLSD